MELILWAALFYAALCVVPVPAHARRVGASRRGVRVLLGGGPRLLAIRPAAACWIAEAIPFTTTSDGVTCAHSLARYAQDLTPRSRHASFDTLPDAVARGAGVRIAGVPFARSSHPAPARRFAALLREVGAKGALGAEDAVAGHLARSLSPSAAREAFDACRATTRWLGRACDAYFALVFVAAPLLVLLLGAERAIFLLIPALLVVHLVCGVLLWRAVRRLPSTHGHRFELLTTALLFPPSLIRAPQDLLRGELALLHPATATALLAKDDLVSWLRRDLARLDAQRPDDPLALAIHARERALLVELAAAHGLSPDDLTRPRERVDPVAQSYCPVCLADYRVSPTPCSDCAVETVAYRARPSPDPRKDSVGAGAY